MKNTVRRIFAVVLAAMMVLSLSGSVFALEGQEHVSRPLEAKEAASYDLSGIRNGNTFDVSEDYATVEYTADQIVPIMVELEDAPALDVYSSVKEGEAYAASLAELQKAAVKSIESALNIKVEVNYSYKYLMNGFSFDGEYRLVEELNKLDGITAYVAPTFDLPGTDLYNSGDMVSAPAAWDLDYSGVGRVVAILDTGCLVTHPAFSNDPDAATARFSRSDIAAIIAQGQLQGSNAPTMSVDNVYFSGKIPFRWNYVKNNYNVAHTTVGSDHGTHVAGIAAGNGGEIVGIAKDAQIVVMNVFNDGGGAGWNAILAGLEDCAVLGVDSANMSLGSPAGFTHYPAASYGATFERLVNAGVNLACSAGNEYSTTLYNAWAPENSAFGYALNFNPDYGITGQPSTWPRSLGVAAVNNSKQSVLYIDYEGDKFAYSETDYNQPKLAETFGNQTVEYVAVPGTGSEEDFATVDVSGKLALVRRGSSTFVEKCTNAQNAGAIGVLIYNNQDGVINMNLEGANLHIPAVSIEQKHGDPMAAAGTGSVYIAAEPELIEVSGGGEPTDFSSWGSPSDLSIKPEITAPGGAIYSSTDPSISGELYQAWDGTSMSSPHVAGGMAIVSEYVDEMFPNLTAAERREMVDAILMSTAVPVTDAGGDIAPVRKQGAGLMNLEAAVTTKAYLSVDGCVRPKLELGDDPEMTGHLSMTFTVNNFGDEDLSYMVEPVVLIDDMQAIAYAPEDYYADYVFAFTQTSWDITEYTDYTCPRLITVPAHGSVDVNVEIQIIDEMLEYLDYYYTSGAFVEGFIMLYGTSGMLGDVNNTGTVTAEDALLALRYALHIDDVPNPGAIDVNDDGNADLTDALLILRYALGVSQDFAAGNLTAGVDMSIPYLSFYGSWNAVPMFDYGFYYQDFAWNSNPQTGFIGSGNNGLGINPYVPTEDYSYYLEDRNAVSPNNDGFLDTANTIRIGLMRNASQAGYQLLDASGNVIQNLANQSEVRKNYYSTSQQVYYNLGTDMSMPNWNAAPYANQQLYIRVYAYLSNEGDHGVEAFTEDTYNLFNEWIIPVYVDVTAPTAEVVSASGSTLTLDVHDDHYVAVVASYTGSVNGDAITIGDQLTKTGLFEDERGATTRVQINVQNGCLVCLADYAGNEVAYQYNNGQLTAVSDTWSHANVEVPDVTLYAYGKNLNSQTWVRFSSVDMDNLYYGGGVQSDANDYTCGTYTGEYVYSVGSNKTLYRRTATNLSSWGATATPVGTISSSYTLNEMAYNKVTGKLYVVSGVGELMEINPANGQVVSSVDVPYGIVAMDFDRFGNCLIVDAYGDFCKLDITTGQETELIGTGYGVNPVNDAGNFFVQCGCYRDGFFFWFSADAGAQYYSDMHIIAIKADSGDSSDLGAVFSGLYTLCLFGDSVELPESSVNHEDFYDNFDGANFDWVTIDADGDGYNWGVEYFTNGYYYDGPKAAVSYSYHPDGFILYPDNWMVSPAFEVGEGERYLSFFTSSKNPATGDISEHYAIYVIPEGGTIADGILVFENTMDTPDLTEFVVDLSAFSGEAVQLAFRHYDCYDQFTFIVDAVAVGSHK